MDFLSLVFILAAIVSSIFLRSNWWPGKKAKLPPGPYPFPIVGNIFQLTVPPHKSFTRLSKTYGPLMSIHLGSLYTIIVSSSEIAKELLQKHDISVSNRYVPAATEVHDVSKYAIGLMPADRKWRGLRKIIKEHMFSTLGLQAGQVLRQEKLQKMCDYVKKCCDDGRVVNIDEAVFITTLNFMSSTLFSAEITSFDSDATQKFKETLEDVPKVLSSPNFADYFPFLKPFDLQGIKRKADVCFGKLLAMMEDIIQERMQSRTSSSRKNDLLETLIDLSQRSEHDLTLNDIKYLLIDLFAAGADSSTSTVEWTMTELLRHPEILSKAKAELMSVIGEGKQPQESDISRLPYLQAVIKESLRYHTPAPLLFPRLSSADIQVGGYSIPKGTQIIFNFFAMTRDPTLWKNPNAYDPERFVGSDIDFRGQYFEFIPFGGGRRHCPGMPLAHRMVHMIVATLIHNFNWKLELGIKPEQLDMREKFDMALKKLEPLKAIPIKP